MNYFQDSEKQASSSTYPRFCHCRSVRGGNLDFYLSTVGGIRCYWWNASKLEKDLREGRVGEKERFKYFLPTFFAWSQVVHGLFFFSKVTFSIETLIFPVVNLTVIVLGIILCYRVNRRGQYRFHGKNDLLGLAYRYLVRDVLLAPFLDRCLLWRLELVSPDHVVPWTILYFLLLFSDCRPTRRYC